MVLTLQLMELSSISDEPTKYFLIIGENTPLEILNKLNYNMFNMVYLDESDLI